MSEHEITHREEVVTNLPQPPRSSWGAVFAGLFAVLATSWLLYLLGVAIGVSVADAADSMLMQSGMPEGVTLWILVSALIAYFIGGATTARLSGTTDETVGMLHGFVVWSVATTAVVVLGYCGVSGLLQTGASFLGNAGAKVATATAATTDSAATGVTGAVGYAADIAAADTELADAIRKEAKNRVAKVVESLDPEGGTDLSTDEIRQSIDQLDRQTIRSMVRDLLDNDQESAAELLADNTSLSVNGAKELVAGVYEALEEKLGDPDNETGLTEDLRKDLAKQAAAYLAKLDPAGGEEVPADTLRASLNGLTPQQYQQIALAIYAGDVERAERVLADNTELEEAQVDELVEGVYQQYQRQIDAVSETANEYAEAASTYAQAVLWSTFAATALGLAMSVLGGWCGADTTRRLYFETSQKVAS